MNWYLYAMRRSPRDMGRSCRSEFWYLNLFFWIFSIIAGFADDAFFRDEHEYIGIAVTLIHLIPFVAVSIRRMHDINRTGWWQLLPPVLLLFACFRGTPGPNRFGPQPRSAAEPSASKPSHNLTSTPQTAPPNRGNDSADVIAEIERLTALRASGGLSEAEFEVMKARALNQAGAA